MYRQIIKVQSIVKYDVIGWWYFNKKTVNMFLDDEKF